MADWYVSSAAYGAIPTWAASTAYKVGQIIRPTAPTIGLQLPQRCTTAGTTAGTEASWSNTNNATTTQGSAVFTCVAGQSTYGWSAAAGNMLSIGIFASVARTTGGDRVFVSSD